ncbi:unnamed protein product [Caenorhabditis auriculariae]|uniref:MRG domain-containing protein n=1 Tax=Caenorhabditis auriculariae TaxID=2777116 RepID=A0A8S1H1T7_9PELO|nr:unnamed protein product [Caenorhabditis auriculariae]
MPPRTKNVYAAGTLILCKHKDVFYEAKINDVKDAGGPDPIYVVHYQGWHKRYDEEIPHSKTDEMFRESTKENIVQAKVERDALTKKKRKSRAEDDELRKSETGSRTTSPSDRAGSHPASIASVKGLGKAVKRKATEAGHSKEPKQLEMEMMLPKPLRHILVDDNDLVARHNLAKLPARHSVRDIVNDYTKSLGLSEENTRVDEVVVEYDNGTTTDTSLTSLVCSASGLVDYFDVLFAYQLLYKQERLQLQRIIDEQKASTEGPTSKRRRKEPVSTSSEVTEDEFKPSTVYGLPHLLRLLTRMPTLFKLSNWNDHLIKMMSNTIHDFVVFLNKNHTKYHNGATDYEEASAEYIKQHNQLS